MVRSPTSSFCAFLSAASDSLRFSLIRIRHRASALFTILLAIAAYAHTYTDTGAHTTRQPYMHI